MKKSFKLLSVILIVMLVLAGCGQTTKTGTDQKPAEKGSEGEPKKQVTLKYWAAPLSKPEIVDKVWKKQIEAFKAETGIDVVYEVVPWAELVKKVTTAITSGDGPDIVSTGNNMSVQLSPTGALLPLTKERLDKIGGRDKFVETVMKVTGEEGKDPVTIPLNGGSGLLVYDKEAYEKVGMTKVPEKWEDFIKYAQKLTDGKVYGYAMFGKPTQSWKMYNNIFNQVRMGKALDDNGVPAFDSAEGKDALRLIADLIGKYKIVPPVAAEWTADDMISAFINGDVKACYVDCENLSILDNSKMAGKYAIGVLPYILPGRTEGKSVVSNAGGTNIGIFAKTKYPEEALKFLEFISRKDVNVEITDSFGVLSSIKGAYDNSNDPVKKLTAEILANDTAPMPLKPYYLASLNIMSQTVQNVMFQATQPGGVTDEYIDEQLKTVIGQVKPLVK